MTRHGWVRTLAISAAASAALIGFFLPWGNPSWYGAPILIAAVTLSELAVIHVAVARQRLTFTLTEGVIAAALLCAPGWWVILAVAGGLAIAQLLRHQPAIKMQFNVAQFAASTAAATFVAVQAGANVRGAVLGMATWWVANQLLSAAPIAIVARQSFWRMAVDGAPLHITHAGATTSLGLLIAWLFFNAPVGLIGLLVPVVLMWISFDEQTSKAAEARLFADLARGQEQAANRSTDASARVICEAASRAMGGAEVGMVLFEHDGPLLYFGDETKVECRRAEPGTLDQPWLLRALGASRVVTGNEGGRPYCSAVVGDLGQPLAVVVVRRQRGASRFSRRDVALMSALLGQARSWLCEGELAAMRDDALARVDAATDAARALSGLGAQTLPALDVLRNSAIRLAQLAARPDGLESVDGIIEGLQSVERAVASLLGAIALAADPELIQLDAGGASSSTERQEPPAQPVRNDWTTTGVVVELPP